jgi:hypothetical protein
MRTVYAPNLHVINLGTPTQAISACTSNGTYQALEREPSDLTSKPTQSLDHTLNH